MAHYVYYLINEDERPIYVGYTNNPHRRIREHRKEKSWFHEVATVEMYRYGTKREAVRAEAMSIKFGEALKNKALHSGIFRAAFEDARNGVLYPILEARENIPVGAV